MKQCAFRATADYRAKHTSLLEFVTPAAAALWNMRWQVRGFLEEVPDAGERELFGRFAAGSGLRAGNLRAIFEEDSWITQLSRFGELLLLSSFALYEGWVSELAEALKLSPSDRNAFSRTLTSAAAPATLQATALAVLGRQTSALAKAQFRPALLQGAHAHGIGAIPHLLRAMRGYKAIRNSIVHRSGRLSDDDVAIIQHASNVKAADIGARAAPQYPSAIPGDVVAASYPSAISCTAVLLKLVVTVDAELSGTEACAVDVLTRVQAHPSLPTWRVMSKEPSARSRKIRKLLSDVGAPSPLDAVVIGEWLKARGVVWY